MKYFLGSLYLVFYTENDALPLCMRMRSGTCDSQMRRIRQRSPIVKACCIIGQKISLVTAVHAAYLLAMNCAAVPLFDAIGEDNAMAAEPLDLRLSPVDLLEFSPAAAPAEYGAGAHDGRGVATTAVCSWDCTSSRGDFELIRISSQLLFLIGSVEGSRTLSYELDATGWTCFAFVLSFSADGLASGADQRASRYLQISRGKSGPRTCPSSAKWTGVICLLKDRMDGPTDEFSAAIAPDAATEEFRFIPPDLAKTAMAVVVSRHNEHSRTLYRRPSAWSCWTRHSSAAAAASCSR